MSRTSASATCTIDERLACAMAFAALAERAATFAQAAVQARAGIFEDGDGADEQAGEERETKREEQHGKIDADFVDAGQAGGRDGDQNAQCAIGEGQAEQAAGHAEDEAFKEQISPAMRPQPAPRAERMASS